MNKLLAEGGRVVVPPPPVDPLCGQCHVQMGNAEHTCKECRVAARFGQKAQSIYQGLKLTQGS